MNNSLLSRSGTVCFFSTLALSGEKIKSSTEVDFRLLCFLLYIYIYIDAFRNFCFCSKPNCFFVSPIHFTYEKVFLYCFCLDITCSFNWIKRGNQKSRVFGAMSAKIALILFKFKKGELNYISDFSSLDWVEMRKSKKNFFNTICANKKI